MYGANSEEGTFLEELYALLEEIQANDDDRKARKKNRDNDCPFHSSKNLSFNEQR